MDDFWTILFKNSIVTFQLNELKSCTNYYIIPHRMCIYFLCDRDEKKFKSASKEDGEIEVALLVAYMIIILAHIVLL